MSIGWMGWPARPAALFGSLMVVSATAPTHFNAEQVRSSKETLWSQLIRNATYALILLWHNLGNHPPRHGLFKIGDYVPRTFVYSPEHAHLR